MMSRRSIGIHRACVAFALALLATVLAWPIPASRFPGISSRSHHLSHFAIPPLQAPRLSVMSATARAVPARAVRPQNTEEKLSRTACLAWFSFHLLPSPSLGARVRDRAMSGFQPASQPLRC